MNRIELVLVLIFTFFVIVVWVTSDVILVKPNTPDDPKIQAMLEPLNATFDQETIKQINERQLATPVRATPRPNASTIPLTQPIPSATPETSEAPAAVPVEATSPLIEEDTQPASTESPLPTESPVPTDSPSPSETP